MTQSSIPNYLENRLIDLVKEAGIGNKGSRLMTLRGLGDVLVTCFSFPSKWYVIVISNGVLYVVRYYEEKGKGHWNAVKDSCDIDTKGLKDIFFVDY